MKSLGGAEGILIDVTIGKDTGSDILAIFNIDIAALQYNPQTYRGNTGNCMLPYSKWYVPEGESFGRGTIYQSKYIAVQTPHGYITYPHPYICIRPALSTIVRFWDEGIILFFDNPLAIQNLYVTLAKKKSVIIAPKYIPAVV